MTARQVLKKLIKEVNVNNLVHDWANLSENSDGKQTLTYAEDACRWCISGHLNRYQNKLSDKEWTKLIQVRKGNRINFFAKHTPNQVKAIFTRWLRKLENE